MAQIQTGLDSVAAADRPIITHGAPSDSDALSRMVDHLIADVTTLHQGYTGLSGDLTAAMQIVQATYTAFDQEIRNLRLLLDLSGSGIATDLLGRAISGFYVTDRIADGTTADIDTVYGQATLPVLRTIDKLVASDLRGNRYVPDSTRIAVYTSPTPVATPPVDDSLFVDDPTAAAALDDRPDTVWRRTDTPGTYAWVRVWIPDALNTQALTNAIGIRMFPARANDLLEVHVRAPGGPWINTHGMVYQEGYNTATDGTQNPLHPGDTTADGIVGAAANVRVHLAPQAVAEVLIAIRVGPAGVWGLGGLEVQYRDYAASGQLNMSFAGFDPATLPLSAVLRGKDEPALAYQSTAVLMAAGDPEVQVAMSQTAAGTSPVLRAIEVRYPV